jgi:hypothetical protein
VSLRVECTTFNPLLHSATGSSDDRLGRINAGVVEGNNGMTRANSQLDRRLGLVGQIQLASQIPLVR